MIRGLYTSASGMAAQLKAQDVSANNLANVNTAGFKKDIPTFVAFPELFLHRLNDGTPGVMGTSPLPAPVGTLGTGVCLEEVVTGRSQGAVQETGRELDFALDGEGFFVVNTPWGRRYTRNGSFKEGPGGELVTAAGYQVLGKNGTVIYTGTGDLADQLLVVNFPPGTDLTKEGDSLYNASTPRQAVAQPRVIQGALEQANVNVVTAMVEMIAGMRAYEANQRALQTQDQTLEKAVNEVGRIR
ncbi:MAG TPA: flagellar hook-basal body protein [Firmicutes bacterium]|nr:flagellar hook-basal body protein [Bacillota bacterium]